MTWTLRFQDGTLIVEGASLSDLPLGFQWDQRLGHYRGSAHLYGQVVYIAIQKGIPYEDQASKWLPLEVGQGVDRVAREYQQEAVEYWIQNQRRGIICIPTGSGKTFVAEMCIMRTLRPTLVVAPTLDLVGQWYDRLRMVFQQDVGILGGGHQGLVDRLASYDRLIIAGQSKSHGVAHTISTLIEAFKQKDRRLIEHIYVLEDCMSSFVVPNGLDFTDETDALFKTFTQHGVHLVQSTDAISDWP